MKFNHQPLPQSNADERALEQQLGWAENTIAVLQRAFACNLPRHGSWHATREPAYIDAKRYYKRGDGLPDKPASQTQLSSVAQLSEVQAYLADRYVVCDQQVARLYSKVITAQAHTLLAEEKHKNLQAVADILQQWRACGSPVQWTVVGGGMTLDVASFAAALAQAQLILIPTTLLAMIDAAHGGKTGVNFPPWGKNQVGAFYFAEHVIMCPAWLPTLAHEEVQAGSWEGIKHAVLAGDAELLHAWLQCQNEQALNTRLLHETAQIKLAIVQRDPYEQGERKILNFGHTLAHALEAVAQERQGQLRHGHAVGIGILYAVLLSQAVGKLTCFPPLPDLINSKAMLNKKQLAQALGDAKFDDAQLWQRFRHYIAQDKKKRGNEMWLLLQDDKNLPTVDARTHAIDDVTLQKTWQDLLSILP